MHLCYHIWITIYFNYRHWRAKLNENNFMEIWLFCHKVVSFFLCWSLQVDWIYSIIIYWCHKIYVLAYSFFWMFNILIKIYDSTEENLWLCPCLGPCCWNHMCSWSRGKGMCLPIGIPLCVYASLWWAILFCIRIYL